MDAIIVLLLLSGLAAGLLGLLAWYADRSDPDVDDLGPGPY